MTIGTRLLARFCWCATGVWALVAVVVSGWFISDRAAGSRPSAVTTLFILLPLLIAYVGLRTVVQSKREGSSRRQRLALFIVSMLPLLGYFLLPIIAAVLKMLSRAGR